MFDPKIIITPSAWWAIGGIITGIGIILGTTVKVLTRNHIHRKEAYKNFETKEWSNERYNTLIDKIESVKEHINTRFEDIKTLIEKR